MSFYKIDNPAMPEGFIDAWRAGGEHLQNYFGESLKWINPSPFNSMGTHLTFILKKTLFFVFVDMEGSDFIHRRELFLHFSRNADAVPLSLPMSYQNKQWLPSYGESGLLNAFTGENLNPCDIASDEKVEMSDWEVYDFSVQIVSNYISENIGDVKNAQSNPEIFPAIWFETDSQISYVIVSAVRYPVRRAPSPDNMNEIVHLPQLSGFSGFFASVGICHSDQLKAENTAVLPLWRGDAMYSNFPGIEEID